MWFFDLNNWITLTNKISINFKCKTYYILFTVLIEFIVKTLAKQRNPVHAQLAIWLLFTVGDREGDERVPSKDVHSICSERCSPSWCAFSICTLFLFTSWPSISLCTSDSSFHSILLTFQTIFSSIQTTAVTRWWAESEDVSFCAFFSQTIT